MLFAIAHAFKLNDGTYAVRSPEFPGCEARDVAAERAREQFGDIHLIRTCHVTSVAQQTEIQPGCEIGRAHV